MRSRRDPASEGRAQNDREDTGCPHVSSVNMLTLPDIHLRGHTHTGMHGRARTHTHTQNKQIKHNSNNKNKAGAGSIFW